MKTNFTRITSRLRLGAAGSSMVILLLGAMLILQRCKKDDHMPPKMLDIELIADNFVSPIGVVAVPDNSKRLFVIDQVGKVWIIDAQGNKLSTPFIDVSSKLVSLNPQYDERGLLGLAFHPDYKNNGRFFLHYTAPPGPGGPEPGRSWNNSARVVEYKVSAADPNRGDISTEKIILELDDPQGNHNGGAIDFGPDGYLYIAIGDGGGADDLGPGHVEDWYDTNAGGNGQDVAANLFGNILRIDVNNGSPYGIPMDNPFVNKPGRDEIYAYGLRNPFRFSFDMGGSHQLYAMDAGQVLYEEINIIKKGGNYGWNVKEGTHCFNAANNMEELAECPTVDAFGNPLIDPVIEINNWQNPRAGQVKAGVIMGGNVYRGREIPGIQGKYIFGIVSQTPQVPNGELLMAKPGGHHGLWSFEEISLKSRPDHLGHYLKGFGQDKEGEIYLTLSEVVGPSGMTGKVYKLGVAKEKDNNGKEMQ